MISKDADFRDSHLLRGSPSRLLLVRTGNIRNADLLGLFEQHMPSIQAAFDEADLVELTTDELDVHSRS